MTLCRTRAVTAVEIHRDAANSLLNAGDIRAAEEKLTLAELAHGNVDHCLAESDANDKEQPSAAELEASFETLVQLRARISTRTAWLTKHCTNVQAYVNKAQSMIDTGNAAEHSRDMHMAYDDAMSARETLDVAGACLLFHNTSPEDSAPFVAAFWQLQDLLGRLAGNNVIDCFMAIQTFEDIPIHHRLPHSHIIEARCQMTDTMFAYASIGQAFAYESELSPYWQSQLWYTFGRILHFSATDDHEDLDDPDKPDTYIPGPEIGDAFREALRYNPQNGNALIQLAEYYEAIHEDQEAWQLMEASLDMPIEDSDDLRRWYTLIALAARFDASNLNGPYLRKLRQLLEQHTALDPQVGTMWGALANHYHYIGKTANALQIYSEACRAVTPEVLSKIQPQFFDNVIQSSPLTDSNVSPATLTFARSAYIQNPTDPLVTYAYARVLRRHGLLERDYRINTEAFHLMEHLWDGPSVIPEKLRPHFMLERLMQYNAYGRGQIYTGRTKTTEGKARKILENATALAHTAQSKAPSKAIGLTFKMNAVANLYWLGKITRQTVDYQLAIDAGKEGLEQLQALEESADPAFGIEDIDSQLALYDYTVDRLRAQFARMTGWAYLHKLQPMIMGADPKQHDQAFKILEKEVAPILGLMAPRDTNRQAPDDNEPPDSNPTPPSPSDIASDNDRTDLVTSFNQYRADTRDHMCVERFAATPLSNLHIACEASDQERETADIFRDMVIEIQDRVHTMGKPHLEAMVLRAKAWAQLGKNVIDGKGGALALTTEALDKETNIHNKRSIRTCRILALRIVGRYIDPLEPAWKRPERLKMLLTTAADMAIENNDPSHWNQAVKEIREIDPSIITEFAGDAQHAKVVASLRERRLLAPPE